VVVFTVISPDSTSGVTGVPLLLSLQLVPMNARPQRSTKLKNTFFMTIVF
jgi:hypothetical protein